MIGVACEDDATISCKQFMDFYADVSLAVFDDQQFINLVSDSWKIQEAAHLKVNQKDLEQLVAAFRHSLMKQSTKNHHEEFVLRELFRNFDRDSNGKLTITELRAMLEKLDITTSDPYLEALMKCIDLNGSGTIEFEEFIHFVVQDRYHKR